MKHIPAELLEDIVRRLVDGLHPEKIILFGSHAYGEPDEASDIDLLIVVSESDEPRHHRARKAYGCLWGFTAPTELVVLTPKFDTYERGINTPQESPLSPSSLQMLNPRFLHLYLK